MDFKVSQSSFFLSFFHLSFSDFQLEMNKVELKEKFFEAAWDGNVEEVKEILRMNPNLDVNWKNGEDGLTVLHRACDKDHDAIVSILLAHPAIDVNAKDTRANTPFLGACFHGSTSCARLLLGDSRVLINEPNSSKHLPLYWAASEGHLAIIKWWIASEREMNLGKPGDDKTDAIGVAKIEGRTEVVTLLESYQKNPKRTRNEVRKALGINGQ